MTENEAQVLSFVVSSYSDGKAWTPFSGIETTEFVTLLCLSVGPFLLRDCMPCVMCCCSITFTFFCNFFFN